MDKATVRVLSNKLLKLLLQFLLRSHLIQLREQLLTFLNGVPIKLTHLRATHSLVLASETTFNCFYLVVILHSVWEAWYLAIGVKKCLLLQLL